MSIFAILLAVMMSVILGMTKSMNKTQSIADAAAQGLRAPQALDKELRYADWVNPVAVYPATSVATTAATLTTACRDGGIGRVPLETS